MKKYECLLCDDDEDREDRIFDSKTGAKIHISKTQDENHRGKAENHLDKIQCRILFPRRKIIITAGSVAAVGMLQGVGEEVFKVIKGMIGSIELDETLRPNKDRHELFQNVFGQKLTGFTIDEGVSHDQLPSYNAIPRRHEDNWRTCRGLLKILGITRNHAEIVDPNDAVSKPEEVYSSDLLAIGSRISNQAARRQYPAFDEQYGLKSELRWFIGENMDYPVGRYVMTDPRKISFKKQEKNPNTPNDFDGKRSEWWSANQKIIDTTGVRPKLPDYREDNGFLRTDYLLINKLPNLITDKAEKGGKDFVHISGVHGTATRSAVSMIKQKSLLEKIESEMETPWFQAIFKMEVNHDDERTESFPVNIKPAEKDFGRWFHPIRLRS